MSDLRGQNPSTAHRKPSKVNGISLTQWIYQSVGINQGRVSTRLRGNNLHILIESPICPEASVVVPKLTQALAAVPLNRLLPEGAPPIYRIIAYGRQANHTKPAWTEPFYLNPQGKLMVAAQDTADHEISSNSTIDRDEIGSSSSIIAAIDLARLGQPDAIARYLSSTFSEMGVAVKARVEELKAARQVSQDDAEAQPDESLASQDSVNSSKAVSHPKRLFIACESAYSPDPLILAEPISQRLRGLELHGFQDAVIFGQVSGEAKPEWLLRVDLTPTDEILKEWSRWGDVQALSRLLNRILTPTEIQLSALLKDSTLHLTCEGASGTVPDKLTAISAIAPILESLAPQGIRAATVYGLSSQAPGDSSLPLSPSAAPALTASPHWVHWLNLPADEQPERAKTALELAQAGDLDAIAFLLTRLLNPNLDRMLATGGIRVQVRHKNDLLHIMTDAPTCPSQNQVGSSLSRFMKPLQISGVTGLRIYGRRAGQKQPLWSYGVDFASRDRLVPEATPEFAASDIYVNELLEPPGALVLRSEVASSKEPSAFERWLEEIVQKVQRSLIRTQLFIPDESDALNPDFATDMQPVADLNQYRGAKVALVWGAAGLLLVIQADWLLGQMLQPKPQPPTPAVSPTPSPETAAKPTPTASPLPKISLKKTPDASASPFNSNGFTQPGQIVTAPRAQPNSSSPITPVVLPASALQPTANADSSFPTFNSRQLDEKIALYQRYVADNGPPDVLVVGSSRALRGVDPVALEKFLASQGYRGVKTFNFGINGATAQVVDLILRQMLPQEKLPKMILFADGARAFNSGRLDITYNGIIASDGYRSLVAGKLPIPGTTVAQAAKPVAKPSPAEQTSVTEEASPSPATGYQAVNQELNQRLGSLSQLYAQRDRLKARLSEYFAALFPPNGSLVAFGRKLTPDELSDATSPAASASNSPQAVLAEGGKVDVNGFLPLPNRFNPVTYYQKYARVSGDYDSDYEAFGLEGRQSESIAAIAEFAQSHQIPLVFVNLPLTNDYLDPIRKQHEEAFQQQMLQWATQYGFTYRDLSQVLANQPDYFSDPSHLNRYGAYEVSRRIAEDVLIPWQKAR